MTRQESHCLGISSLRAGEDAADIGNQVYALFFQGGHIGKESVALLTGNVQDAEFADGTHDVVDVAENKINLSTQERRVLVSSSLIKNLCYLGFREELAELQVHQMMAAEGSHEADLQLIGIALREIKNFLEILEPCWS